MGREGKWNLPAGTEDHAERRRGIGIVFWIGLGAGNGFYLFMDAEIIERVARETLEGTISFPEVVRQLLEAGVEYYLVDYAGRRKFFYSATGEVIMTAITFEGLPEIAADFSAEKLRLNIRDSQTKDQKFRDFTRRAMEAGVQGYQKPAHKYPWRREEGKAKYSMNENGRSLGRLLRCSSVAGLSDMLPPRASQTSN